MSKASTSQILWQINCEKWMNGDVELELFSFTVVTVVPNKITRADFHIQTRIDRMISKLEKGIQINTE